MEELKEAQGRIRLTLFLFVLLAFALRLYRLDHQSLRGDEAVTISYSGQGFIPMLHIVSKVDIHPPLYYSLTSLWIRLTGNSEFAARFLSLIFGVLAVPLVFRLGQVLVARDVGLLAAFILAFNSFHIWVAQDARMYTLIVSLALASAILFLEALKTGKRGLWVIYGFCTLLALYTHYYALLLIVGQGLFFFLYWQRHKVQIWPWFVSQAIPGFLFLPWLLLEFHGVGAYEGAGESAGLFTMLARIIAAFGAGLTIGEEARIILAVIFSLSMLLGLLLLGKEKPYAFWFLSLFMMVPIGGLYLASRTRALFMERYLLPASPAYYLIISSGLMWGRKALSRRNGLVLLASTTVLITGANFYSLSNYYFDPQYAKSPDWRSLAEYVRENQKEGDMVIQNYLDQSFLYYYRGQAPLLVLPLGLPPDLKATERKLEGILAQYERIWLMPDVVGTTDPRLFVERWLDRRCYQASEVTISSLRLKLYLPPAVFLPRIQHPLSVRIGEGVELIGYDIEPLALRAKDTLRLTLYWRALAKIDKNYTVFTHLIDEKGGIWGQKDNPPQVGRFPTRKWTPGDIIVDVYEIPLSPQTPPGLLSLEIGMYLSATGERLPVYGTAGEVLGDRILLPTQVRVAP